MPTKTSRSNRERLLAFKDLHKGERCVIVANGPSLRNTDLSLLKGVRSIGMNRIYLLEAVNGYVPDYLAVTDTEIQLEQFTDEYDSLSIVRFFNWNARRLFHPDPSLLFFKESFKVEFQPNFVSPIGTGKSVTFTCIQLAYFMGFKEVVLVGKDHKYDIQGYPQQNVKSDGVEQNHFIAGYYRPNMRWRIPDIEAEEMAYRLAREAFEADGRAVYDGTVGGHLNVFKKVDLHSFIGS